MAEENDEPREMLARIDEVHYDKKGEECPITHHESMSDQIHIVLQPVDRNWKKQHWFIYDSTYTYSTAFKVIEKFADLGLIDLDNLPDGNENIYQKIQENAVNEVIEFTEKKVGRSKKNKWFPVGIVD